jgi:hypothetical protein
LKIERYECFYVIDQLAFVKNGKIKEEKGCIDSFYRLCYKIKIKKEKKTFDITFIKVHK